MQFRKGMRRRGNLEREDRKGMNRKRDSRRGMLAKCRPMQLSATVLIFYCGSRFSMYA